MKKDQQQIIEVPAAAKEATVATLIALDCPQPSPEGKNKGRIQKTKRGTYIVNIQGLPEGSAETLRTYQYFSKQ